VVAASAPVIERWQGEAPVYGRPEDPLYDRLGVRWVLAEPGAELPSPLRVVMRDGAASVWERPGVRPIVRLADSAQDGAVPSGAQLRILGTADTQWSAEFTAPEPQRLETALYQDGGWRLLLDGVRRPTEAARAGSTARQPFVAAGLPRGEHRLELMYRPPGLLLGGLLAALGCSALLGVLLRPR
jgi:hypothetical protein